MRCFAPVLTCAGFQALPLANPEHCLGSTCWGLPPTDSEKGHPPSQSGHSHMLSCRTKLAMLLCLKYLGSTSLANWPWSNTWKLFPLCQETQQATCSSDWDSGPPSLCSGQCTLPPYWAAEGSVYPVRPACIQRWGSLAQCFLDTKFTFT